MQVVRSNFLSSLDIVRQAICDAAFITFDTEFTGLLTPPWREEPLDTIEKRYETLTKGSSPFLVTQFGVCTYHWLPTKKKFAARPFNFHCFPVPIRNFQRDIHFQCQSSSIEFLVRNGFDFNKVFYEGVSFLRPDEEKSLRAIMSERQKQLSLSAEVSAPVPENMKPFVANIRKQLEAFESEEAGTIYDLPPSTGFQRKLTFQVGATFQSLRLQSETNEKGQRFVRVVRLIGEQSEEALLEEAKRKDEIFIDEAVGIGRVFDLIIQSHKLVVGHNCFLDLIHAIRHYYCALPEEFSEFQKLVCELFPRLVDNKLFAKKGDFKMLIENTSLGDLWQRLQEDPFQPPDVEFDEGFALDKEHYHNAAYDAYITGRCFLTLLTRAAGASEPPEKLFDCNAQPLQGLVHRLNWMKTIGVEEVNLAGENPCPSHKNVLLMTFPEKWRVFNILSFFEEVTKNLNVRWINDTSAYIILNDEELLASDVVSRLVNRDSSCTLKCIDTRTKTGVKRHHEEDASCLDGTSFQLPPKEKRPRES